MTPSVAKALDLSAVGLSGLCLAHCLALPALALLLPVLGTWAEAEWVHMAFVMIAVPVAALAFVDLRARRPHSWSQAWAAAGGLMLMAAGALGFPSVDLERPLTVVGGLVLAAAHVANWRRRHRCGDCA